MFSVIIPAYNAEKFIVRSIKSVLDQNYTDFELIIVDDGSTDGTKGQIEQFSDNRIRYVYQENGGVSAARNKGILESKGEYICFLDSDDEWKPDHLSLLCKLIEKYSGCGLYRGVILLAIHQAGLQIHSYKPMQVKQAVVGYGNATKHQVQDMTKRLLHLTAMPKPDDAADAIAIALCHARSSTSLLAQASGKLKVES